MRLQVVSSNSTYYWSVTNAAPAKPYLQISNQYLPLTTATRAGIKLKVQSGNTTYRAAVYESGYYNTTSAAVGNLSSTTALTRASTSGTTYLTRLSTSGTNYGTRASTSGTTYLTRASTSGYATRVSTSGYGTRVSTSGYATRVSTSGYATSAQTKTVTITNRMAYSPYYDNGGTLTAYPVWSITYTSGGKTGSIMRMLRYTGRCTSTYMYGPRQIDQLNSTDFYLEVPYSNWTKIEYLFRANISENNTSHEWYTIFQTFTNGNTYSYQSSAINTRYTDYGGFYNAYAASKGMIDLFIPNSGDYQRTLPFTNGNKNTCPVYKVTQNFGVTTMNNSPRWYTFHNYHYSISRFPYTGTWTYEVYNKATKVGTVTGTSSMYQYVEVSLIDAYYSSTQTYASTNAVTTATLTRASTSATLTRASTSATYTRASTSATLTRASTSGTNYGTRASTSGTTYLTRLSTSGTNYGTRASTSAYSGKLSSSKWG